MSREVWNIVIVDDSPDDRAEVRRLLLKGSEHRYAFTEAETGAAGLRALRGVETSRHRCLVLDYYLPDMAAPAFLAAISGGDGAPDWPVVVFTGGDSAATGRSAIRAGAHDYVGKDWMTQQVLVRAVENATERWTMARDLRQQTATAQACERHFSALARATSEVVYCMSADGSAMRPFDGCTRGAGADTALEPWAWLKQTVPADEHDRVRQAISDAIATKSLFALEHRVLRPDGSIGWTSSRAVPTLDANGDVLEWFGAAADITARVEAEHASRRSETFLQRVAAITPGVLHVFDLAERRAVFINRSVASLLGFTPEQVKAMGSDVVASLMHPEDVPRFEQHVARVQALPDSEVVEFEHRMRDVAGRWHWFHTCDAVFERDEAGAALQILGVSMDITARKEAELGLASSEQQFRMLADSIPQLCFMIQPNGQVIWYNQRWYDYSGATCEQMQGTGWEVLHDPKVLPEVRERWKHAIALGDPFEMVFPLKDANGRYRQFLSRVLPVKDAHGAVTLWFGTNTDITAVKDAEAVLARREWELHTLADHIPDIVARFDRTLRHLFINAAVERVTGLAAADFLGKTNREMGMPIGLCEMWDAALTAVFDKGQPVSRDFSYDSVTGPRYFHCTLIPERGAAGEVESVLGVTRDRTDEKQAQDALRTADRRKDEFLATLAHELRNPLAPLRTGLKVLQLTQDRSTMERTQSMMQRQLEQTVRLIDDLLDISRITSGKIVLRPARIELQAAIRIAIEAVQPLLDAAAQVLVLDLPAKPLWIQADPTRISQIVSNLLTNAAKFSPHGSSIALALQPANSTAVVTVTDSGEGIPQNMLSHIFEMFTQVDGTLDRAQGGLGIGLALVKRLVEMHGGTVSAASAGLGAGSTFTLRLPMLGEPAADLDGPVSAPVAAASGTSLRVLVVDDNEDAAQSLADLVSLYGHEARVADCGASALAIASVFKPAVVFLDIGMPGMNGYDTARRMRAGDPSGCMTLVALTGWGAESDRIKAKDAGFDHHFTKPPELGRVDRVLEQVARRQAGSRPG